jgi:hypothetical protein
MSKINQQGFSIVEILIVTGVASMLIVSVAKNMSTADKLNAVSRLKTQMADMAVTPLEIVNGLKGGLFACTGTNGTYYTVGADKFCQCGSGSEVQICKLFPAYTSCWTEYPAGQTGKTEFYLSEAGGSWQLLPLASGASETISVDGQTYNRKIIITNALRDSNFNIASAGTVDFNTKIITVQVSCLNRGNTYNTEQRMILTGWENL